MRNEILIPSAVIPNAYFLGPMGNPDPSDFIHQETNQILFKQSTVDFLLEYQNSLQKLAKYA